jgi:hypothetical protein
MAQCVLPLYPYQPPYAIVSAARWSRFCFSRGYDLVLTSTVIFGQPAVHCPLAKDCYCKVFGMCELMCQDQGSCEGRYTLPPYATLPKGWPYIGWDGQPRQRAAPEQ